MQAVARRRVRQVSRSVVAGMKQVQRTRLALSARGRTDQVRFRLDGRWMTVADIGALGGALAVAAVPDADPSHRPVRFAGRGLSVVNAVTFVVLLGHLLGLDPSRPDPGLLLTTVVLAVCSATAQAVLAVDVGRRLRPGPVRRRPPEPTWPVVSGAGLLAASGGLAFAASFGWAQQMGSGSAAVAAGLVLGASALAAPFVLVADEATGPGPEARLLGRAERILARRTRRRERLERRADCHLAGAERMLWRAWRALAVVADQLGADHPITEALTDAVVQLRAEVAAARSEYAADPLGPDDLGLAG